MAIEHQLGIQVRAFRKERGLSQEALAESVGCAANTISNIENGKSLAKLGTLVRISEALDRPLRDFFDFDGATAGDRRKREKLAALAAVARDLSPAALEDAITLVRNFAKE